MRYLALFLIMVLLLGCAMKLPPVQFKFNLGNKTYVGTIEIGKDEENKNVNSTLEHNLPEPREASISQ